MKIVILNLAMLLPTAWEVSAEPYNLERRVVLDENFNWMTPGQVDKVLSRIERAGFNVFVPAVWHGRGVSWVSKLAIREPRWEQNRASSSDPLKMLIDKAHEKNIEVHPWFTVVLRQREILREYSPAGTPSRAFNVHNIAYRDFIIELMLEVVEKYDIDGVNLDYIRSMGNCMSAECLADYKNQFDRDLRKDSLLQWSNPVASFHIAKWNEKPVTDIVKRFSEKAKKIKPDLVISVDTHPINNRLSLEGSQAIKWANAGYVDVIYDMQYQNQLDTQTFEIAKSHLEDPSKLVLMIGNFSRSIFNKSSVKSRDQSLFLDHVVQGRGMASDGGSIAVYEYRYLSDEQIGVLRRGPFRRYVE